jgi:hypothetical protein
VGLIDWHRDRARRALQRAGVPQAEEDGPENARLPSRPVLSYLGRSPTHVPSSTTWLALTNAASRVPRRVRQTFNDPPIWTSLVSHRIDVPGQFDVNQRTTTSPRRCQPRRSERSEGNVQSVRFWAVYQEKFGSRCAGDLPAFGEVRGYLQSQCQHWSENGHVEHKTSVLGSAKYGSQEPGPLSCRASGGTCRRDVGLRNAGPIGLCFHLRILDGSTFSKR